MRIKDIIPLLIICIMILNVSCASAPIFEDQRNKTLSIYIAPFSMQSRSTEFEWLADLPITHITKFNS